MRSDFVNQTRKAGEIRRKAQLVQRDLPRHAQQAFDHGAPAFRTWQVEWMRVREKPLERGRTFDRMDRWSRRIQLRIARHEVNTLEHPHLSRRCLNGRLNRCGDGLILPVFRCAPASRDGIDHQRVNALREWQRDCGHAIVVHTKDDGVVCPVHGVPTRETKGE